MEKPKHGPSNKLAVIVEAARDQPSNLDDEIAPELVSFVLVEGVSVTADNGPRGVEYSHERHIVEFS